MKTLALSALALVSFAAPASASFDECPKLRGTYFCPAVVGSHKDMTMIITNAFASGMATYYYLYEQRGEKAFELRFMASDEGTRNPDVDGVIGKCVDGYYFNSPNGRPAPNTLLNFVNERGDYEVIRYQDRKSFLYCKRVR